MVVCGEWGAVKFGSTIGGGAYDEEGRRGENRKSDFRTIKRFGERVWTRDARNILLLLLRSDLRRDFGRANLCRSILLAFKWRLFDTTRKPKSFIARTNCSDGASTSVYFYGPENRTKGGHTHTERRDPQTETTYYTRRLDRSSHVLLSPSMTCLPSGVR